MIWYVYDLERQLTVASYCYRGTAIKEADRLNARRHKNGKRYEAMPHLRLLQVNERERLSHVMREAPECTHCHGTGKDLSQAIRAFHDKRFTDQTSGEPK